MGLKRMIAALIIVPVALILIVFIIANREMMSVHFNPFDMEDLTLTLHAPAFVFLFAALAIGVVVGSITTWLSQHAYRKKARLIDEARTR